MPPVHASNNDPRFEGVARQLAERPVEPAVAHREGPDPGSACGDWTDRQLVFATATARDVAFAELFRRHSCSVAAVARTVLGPNSGCEDVVAEVFTSLWCAPEKFDPERGSLLGFLRVRARSRSIDLLRSESSRQRREYNDERVKRSPPTAEVELIAAESVRELRGTVSRLSDDERIAIELAYFGGMSYRSVALHLGLPEGTVKSRIRSGLQHLRGVVE